ncbi:BZ3500_MvSof-1268-A1-R1_Chr2-3g05354 [Microbotryum saponariae]|uniref:BZ3500_MvSof-1268-A1-R1_Chr2-3g05354 protein n=1 Tax=Microbotryum saponariae TaxID=289078 RepID=A0A2X0KBE1_9BASI|nr:BZ3500_MvSof-1268-A1-R1_Chr2-3g05354 [Microbotryum saponariae]SDA01260.1 BZ3501_MvSof-1269-A2-R1_Chr2-2g05027 [Microbotryum saponariae]
MSKTLVPSVSFSGLYGLVSSPLKGGNHHGSSTPSGGLKPIAPPVPSRTNSSDSTTDLPLLDNQRQHHHHQQQQQYYHHPNQVVASRHPSQYSAVSASVPEAQLQLSTECPSCAHPVVLKVPSALLAAANVGHHNRLGMEQYDDGRYFQQQVDHRGGRQLTEKDRREQWRAGVVGGAVRAAKAFKESRFPELLWRLFQFCVGIILWLDMTFHLRQRIMVVVWAVLEDLVKIEREVGILRNSGEAISVLWEAAVKGTIALAKSEDGPSTTPAPAPSPMHHSASPYGGPSTMGMYPFPTMDHHGHDQPPYSYPCSPTFHPHPQQRAGTASPSAYAQPSFTYTSEDDISNLGDLVDSSSSDQELTPQKSSHVHLQSTTRESARTLRRTAYSTPSLKGFALGIDGSVERRSRSGISTPGANHASAEDYYFDGLATPRPTMVRKRSRSGPEEKPRRDAARGWAETLAGAVSSRIIRPSA